MLVPTFQPLMLGRAPEPFSHPDWLFEVKWDGFRSLVRIEQGKCRLISRKGNEFKSFRILNESVLSELKVKSTVLDGEIVCFDGSGANPTSVTCSFDAASRASWPSIFFGTTARTGGIHL